MISKDSLEQSIQLIILLNLNDIDYERIFKCFKKTFSDNDSLKIINDLIISLETKDPSINEIMKEIPNIIEKNDLSYLINRIIKNPKAMDFIQDLFLEKLI